MAWFLSNKFIKKLTILPVTVSILSRTFLPIAEDVDSPILPNWYPPFLTKVLLNNLPQTVFIKQLNWYKIWFKYANLYLPKMPKKKPTISSIGKNEISDNNTIKNIFIGVKGL